MKQGFDKEKSICERHGDWVFHGSEYSRALLFSTKYTPKQLLSLIETTSLDTTFNHIISSLMPNITNINQKIMYVFSSIKQGNIQFSSDQNYFYLGNSSFSFITCSSLKDGKNGLSFSAYTNTFLLSVWIILFITIILVTGKFTTVWFICDKLILNLHSCRSVDNPKNMD